MPSQTIPVIWRSEVFLVLYAPYIQHQLIIISLEIGPSSPQSLAQSKRICSLTHHLSQALKGTRHLTDDGVQESDAVAIELVNVVTPEAAFCRRYLHNSILEEAFEALPRFCDRF